MARDARDEAHTRRKNDVLVHVLCDTSQPPLYCERGSGRISEFHIHYTVYCEMISF